MYCWVSSHSKNSRTPGSGGIDHQVPSGASSQRARPHVVEPGPVPHRGRHQEADRCQHGAEPPPAGRFGGEDAGPGARWRPFGGTPRIGGKDYSAAGTSPR